MPKHLLLRILLSRFRRSWFFPWSARWPCSCPRPSSSTRTSTSPSSSNSSRHSSLTPVQQGQRRSTRRVATTTRLRLLRPQSTTGPTSSSASRTGTMEVSECTGNLWKALRGGNIAFSCLQKVNKCKFVTCFTQPGKSVLDIPCSVTALTSSALQMTVDMWNGNLDQTWNILSTSLF